MLNSVSARVVSPVLVGRGDELMTLGAAFGATPSTVLIGGEAGVGKSRLIQEFAGSLADRGRVLTGGCVEPGGVPYAPFTAALRPLVRQLGADPEMARARLFDSFSHCWSASQRPTADPSR